MARMYCFIDTLLTSDTVVEAYGKTAARWSAMKETG